MSRWRSYGITLAAALAAWASAAAAEPAGVEPEAAIRAALSEWALAFNAGDSAAVCALFAPELRFDYRGFPERGFAEVCGQLQASLADPNRKYAYDVTIKEVLVLGDLAAVRLTWTLTVRRPGEVGGIASREPGLDIFRRQPDGSWKIVRYIAYDD
jgi:steroid delta-isomerase